MIAYFDCFSGVAGDMTLAALIDCGVPVEKLREGLSSLAVEGWDISVEPVLKNGIHALSARITLHGESDEEELQRQTAGSSRQESAHSQEHSQDHEHAHSHNHEHSHQAHSHEHNHAHSHDEIAHDHSHSDAHSHGETLHASLSPHHSHAHGRSMREIREIITSSTLAANVQETALKIFGVIAQAEAKMHHTTPDDVHFHEIGGVDSLIDICGVAWCLNYLEVDEVYCSALPHSTGHVHCAHGIMPVPAPATLEILKDAPWFPTGIKGEMITPTGAAIVKALATKFEAPTFTPRMVGVGAGKKNWPDRPNILRVVIGEKSLGEKSLGEKSESAKPHNEKTATSSTRFSVDGLETCTLSLVETNIDDMNPELWDYVFEKLFAAGALDVWLENVQMKKNRPAQTLRVLVDATKRDEIVTIVLRETTTLGVRLGETTRVSLPREIKTVTTKWGAVRVKVARWDEENLERATPEYDDVARIARGNDVAVREVYEAAQRAYKNR